MGKGETHRQPFKLWLELHIFNMAQKKVCLYFYLFSSKAIRYYPKVLIYYVNLGSILEYRALYSRCNGCIFKDLIIIRVRTEDWFSMFQTYQNNLPLQYYYITILSLGPKQKQTRCSFEWITQAHFKVEKIRTRGQNYWIFPGKGGLTSVLMSTIK